MDSNPALAFAKKFTDIDDKASKDSGFFYNPWEKRIEYHLGAKFIAAVSLDTLDGDPDYQFDQWSDKILGRARSHG